MLFVVLLAHAQSEAETLEWLRAKQREIRSFTTNGIKYPSVDDAKLVIDEKSITGSNNKSKTKIPWDKIKYVSSSLGDVIIVSNELADGENTFIRLRASLDVCTKYAKALKHYSTLKGAKLIKEDLF